MTWIWELFGELKQKLFEPNLTESFESRQQENWANQNFLYIIMSLIYSGNNTFRCFLIVRYEVEQFGSFSGIVRAAWIQLFK